MDVLRYYLGTLVVGIAVAGLYLGAGWVWLGIGTFPVLMALDVLLPPDLKKRNIKVGVLSELPLYLHLPLMVGMWALLIHLLGDWGGADSDVSTTMVVGALLSVGWIGAVPNVPISHELMHRRGFLRVLSRVYSTFYLDPNRDMGHRLTHHLDLCTEADSDTAKRGQNIYSFMWQASYGSWHDGLMISVNSLRKRDLSLWNLKNSLYVEVGFLATLVLAVYAGAGLRGVAIAVITLVFSKLLAEGFNYLQHYGLVRVSGAPIQLHHAWNHLGAIIRPLGYEITNHINHHFDSNYRYYQLEPRSDGAQMPSAFVCFAAALVPPIWYSYVAQPRLQHWDSHFASPEEQELAMAQNMRAGWPQWLDVQQEKVAG
jgi:xylene monooxygenase subunit XylM